MRTLFGESKYAKQTGGRGQYGHVRLRVILDDGVQGVVFRNALAAEAIPARFLPAIESGVVTAINAGMLAQYGYADARVELCDGSWHDVDSSDLAFFIAAGMALQDALRSLPRGRQEFELGDEGAAGTRMPRVPRPSTPRDAAEVAEPDDESGSMLPGSIQ
jgi:hypothetical protein